MEDSPMSGLPGPIPPDRGPKSSPNEVLTAKLQAQDLQLKAGNLEANPQIFSADTATAPPNPPGNLILGDGI
ncbi:hypothetical protein MCOR04_011837, partial [Pyricularia oryzae]